MTTCIPFIAYVEHNSESIYQSGDTPPQWGKEEAATTEVGVGQSG
jgi:hypothetical protein